MDTLSEYRRLEPNDLKQKEISASKEEKNMPSEWLSLEKSKIRTVWKGCGKRIRDAPLGQRYRMNQALVGSNSSERAPGQEKFTNEDNLYDANV